MTIMLGFLVAARASFTAASTASAPEFQRKTVSSEGCGRIGINSFSRVICAELKPMLTCACLSHHNQSTFPGIDLHCHLRDLAALFCSGGADLGMAMAQIDHTNTSCKIE